MIVSETPNRSSSRWLQACVLLCAMFVLPPGLAYAQDYEAVERRLGEAVSEGELSLKQAAVMMDALKEATEDDRDDDGDIERRFEGWIGSVGEKLKAAVEAGKLSEEDAWRKWHHFKESELAPKLKATVASGQVSEEWALSVWHGLEKAEIGERLKAAVAKGEMTEEEAWAKWKAINRGHDKADRGKAAPGREELAEIGRKIRAAVEAGEITEEQARAKMAGLEARAHLMNVRRELGAAVEAGRISKEDAARKFEAAEREVRERMSRDDKGDDVDWDAIKRRIEGAVKRGDMTREQADAKYREIKMRAAGGKKDIDREAIGRKLKEAVKAGKLTEEEAREKWEAIQK